MLKWLATLPLCAIAVPTLSPDALLAASNELVKAMFVVTPPLFLAGVGFSLLRRSEV